MDIPGARKCHQGNIPLVGGIAIFIAFTVAILSHESLALGPLRAVFAASIILVLVGVLDDMHELKAIYRLYAQLIAALILVFQGDYVIRDLGFLFNDQSSIQLGVLAVPFTIFAIVGVINAVNMIDGVDGLAGSVVVIALLTILLLISSKTAANLEALITLLIAAIAGFLVFNLPVIRCDAKIFLGDTGSMFLGLVLAALIIELTQQPARQFSPVVGLWVLALPIVDTLSLILRRLYKGQSPFLADRNHFHHILQRIGLSKRWSLFVIVLLSCVFSSVAVWGHLQKISDTTLLLLFFSLFLLYFLVLKKAWRLSLFFKRWMK